MRALLTLLFALGSVVSLPRPICSAIPAPAIASRTQTANPIKHERKIGRAYKRGSPLGAPIVLGERSWTRDGKIATIVTVNATGTGELSEERMSSLARYLNSRTTRSQIAYTYDAAGRVVEELRSSLGVSYRTKCTYDSARRSDGASISEGTHYDGGKISGYRMTLYDASDSILSVCEFDRNHKLLSADSITFDAQHKRLKETYMEFGKDERLISGDSRSYEYDDAGRLLSVAMESGGRTYATHHYSYDANARQPSSLADGDRQLRYKYDGDGRLLEESESYAGKTMGYRRFEYDEHGTLTRESSLNAKEQLVDQITYELTYW